MGINIIGRRMGFENFERCHGRHKKASATKVDQISCSVLHMLGSSIKKSIICSRNIHCEVLANGGQTFIEDRAVG